jgi:UDP-N-acetylglucosamine 4,6-dehydratase/5-epimerase
VHISRPAGSNEKEDAMDFLRPFSDGTLSLKGKSVLVTGATGSFGHTFVHHAVHALEADRIVIFSRDELKQSEMQLLYPRHRYPQIRFFIGDIRDRERLEAAMRGIDIVVHAAALKHVPAMEYNPFECVQTNIHGAENLVRAAIGASVKQVVALSTDKAAEPVNLYGASKLVSDKIFISANNITGRKGCRFSVVRYGNVANSRGSVIPLFRRLLENGTDHLPITDPRMTRFIITLDLGVDLVCLALQKMNGGEVWVPRLPSIRIVDLATAMAPDLEQRIVGIRPGEKIHESLIPQASARMVLETDNYFIIQPEPPYSQYAPPADTEWRTVDDTFQYESGSNTEVLTVDQIRSLLEKV